MASYLKTKWPEGDSERSSVTLPAGSRVSKVEVCPPGGEDWFCFESLEEARREGWVQVQHSKNRMTIVTGHNMTHIFVE